MSRRPRAPAADSAPTWHALEADAAALQLDSERRGLHSDEAARRLERYGSNLLPEGRRRGPLRRLIAQFNHVLLYVMMAAAAVTAALGHYVDTGVLLAAVVVNAVIGFIQEGKAESAMEAIRALLSPRATVLRDGRRSEIDAAELVPGDRVLLASGDRVPADLRLVELRECRVDEAALTGESLPVSKSTDPVALDAPLGDRRCMAYSGTLVVSGQATGLVVATGTTTELGRINRMLADVHAMQTPLLRQVDRFARQLAIVIGLLSLATFVLGTLGRGHSPADMFLMVVALAASAIPEGLPAIMTVTLALGVQAMARRNAIIRRLPAVEALGSVTVICSDKTGTLTRNEMTVQRVVCADQVFDVTGVGYRPEGDLILEGQVVDSGQHPPLALAIRAGALCNDARLVQDGEQWRIEGDPTEGALLVLGEKAGFGEHVAHAAWSRIDVIPFESEHRFMATWHRDDAGASWIFVKGAPERVLEMCDVQLEAGGERALDVDYWRRMATDLAARGLRVLALACRHGEPAQGRLDFDDVARGYVVLGLVGIIDPPREEARLAVAECRDAGIRVKMITGDHVDTARAIGAQLSIGVGRPALSGAEIALMDDAALREVVGDIDVFARASPEHKLRLVDALQHRGEVVAMTGDGVNDAPALKRADVGVAMGMKGTEAAKEAAGVVLADDNFATITAAVREGRGVYDNLTKFVLFMLPTNGGEALVVIAAILFDLVLPMTAAQVLWINLATSSTLGLALAFEAAEPDVMKRRPRPPGESLLTRRFVWRTILISLMMMIGALGLFLLELQAGSPVEKARTMAVNAVVVAELFYLLCCRSAWIPALSRLGLTGNLWIQGTIALCIALQLAYTYAPPMQRVFGSVALDGGDWMKVIAAGVLVFAAAEIEKAIMRRRRARDKALSRVPA